MSRHLAKLMTVPITARAVGKGVLVKDTSFFSSEKAGLIYLPPTDRQDLEKDFMEPVEVGEVVSVGGMVEGLSPGDFVVYRRITAYAMPNSFDPTFLWKIESPTSIIAKIDAEDLVRPVQGGE